MTLAEEGVQCTHKMLFLLCFSGSTVLMIGGLWDWHCMTQGGHHQSLWTR